MIRKHFSKRELSKVSLTDLKRYLKQKNWEEDPTEHKNKKILVFKGPSNDKGYPLTLIIPENINYKDSQTRISDAINVLGAIENVDPEEILKKILPTIYKNDIRIYENYYLRKWSNLTSRSMVGIICTIGPSVFVSEKENKIQELIEAGMNIARINLSHFRLDENEQPVDLDKMVAIIKTIRRCSDGLRIPVNIMADLKGPEIRVAFFSVSNLKKIVSVTSMEIKEESQFKIVLYEPMGPITVKEPILVLSIRKGEFKEEFIEGKAYCLSIEDKTDITLECEKKNNDNSFDFKITKVHSREGRSFNFEVQDGIDIFKDEKKRDSIVEIPKSNKCETFETPKIIGIYESALRIEQGMNIVLTTDKERYYNKIEPVIYLNYDGNFGKDIAVHNMSDPIYLDDGKASFKLINKEDRDSPIVEVIYGKKVELRKSMNLFNNTCDSAKFVSKIDENYLESILTHKEFKKLCPIDSVAVSFVRKSSDLDRIDTILQEYGVKEKKNWDIKLVAKIESPHCFMKRYIHKKERFNQEEIDYKEYSEILNNNLCWAVMVDRGDLGVEIEPAMVPYIQKEIIDRANIAGKGVIVDTQMLVSMVNNNRPSSADVTDIHNVVLNGADVVMLSDETSKGNYPIDALKCMRSIVNKAVKELMETERRDVYLKKILKGNKIEKSGQLMELLDEPIANISLKSGSPVIFSYALTGRTVTKISRYRPDKPIIAITNNEMAARNMLFYFGVFPLFFVGIDEENSTLDKSVFDFPRDVKDYRQFLKDIIDKARDEKNDFFFEKLKDITDGQIVFGLLGIDHKSSFLSDRAIVNFRYQESGQEQKQDDTVQKTGQVGKKSDPKTAQKTGLEKPKKQVRKTGSKKAKTGT